MGSSVKGLNTGLEKVKELLRAERAAEAQKLFDEILVAENVDYLLVKGELEQKFQHWGKAYNSFGKVLEIDPLNTEAKIRMEMVEGILNFFSPDQFNP
jgi:tetratricopeptide (TPR) repeat protein